MPPPDPRDGITTEVVYWFDHSAGQRLWVIQVRDHVGNQINDAQHRHAKADAVACARELATAMSVKARHLKAGDA